jgi:branched-chain amino acid transport system substrate-binding protein
MSLPRRHLSRRQALGGGAALAVLSAPYVRARAAAPIRIGFPVPLTGPYQEEALDMLRGGHAAVAVFNGEGGLNGQMAQLLTRDDELDAATAAEVTRKLIADDQVAFITGGLSASVQLAINEATTAAKLLFNSISQSDAIVAAPARSPYTFHEALTPHATTQAVGRHVFAHDHGRVAFLVADYAFGNEMLAGFQRVGKQYGIEVVATVRHKLGTGDFRAELEQIRAARPQVLVLCNFGYDQRNAIQQAAWLGLGRSVRLVAPVLDFTARLDLGAGPYRGVVGGTSYYWRLEDSIPSARRFNDRFRMMNDGRVPSDYGALGFAGVMTVLTAAKQTGSITTSKLIEAMQGMRYDLYKGPQTYRACDHQSVQSALIVESRATTGPTDMDVFRIVRTYPPDEAMLDACNGPR